MKITFECNSLNDLKELRDHLNKLFETKPEEPKSEVPSTLYVDYIDALNLDIRTINVLKASDIFTVSQLIKLSDIEVLKCPNMGRKSLRLIKEELATLNLSLRG